MSAAELLLRLVHVLSAAVLFGTGAGIAFFMLRAHLSRDPATVAAVAPIVVLADWVFTATAVVVQPLSGVALAHLAGWSLTEPWLLASYGLYLLVGACWLPVVAIQLRLRVLARQAVAERTPLPARYHRLFRLWFVLGWPAFAGVIGIYVLMLWRPV